MLEMFHTQYFVIVPFPRYSSEVHCLFVPSHSYSLWLCEASSFHQLTPHSLGFLEQPQSMSEMTQEYL
jgi:hypothetical protein